MSGLNCRSGFRRRAPLVAVLALAVAGQFPGLAAAEPRHPAKSLFKLDLTWTASLMPVPTAPVDAPEPAPLLSFDDAPNQLMSEVPSSPGLQFSLNPDTEEVFLGWEFEF